MKRNINEIYELIKKKIKNCDVDIKRNNRIIEDSKFLENKPLNVAAAKNDNVKLGGMYDAYLDVKILIETSGVLENDKWEKR